MAYSFNGTDQRLSASSSPVSGVLPVTMAAYAKRATTDTIDTFFGCGLSDASAGLFGYFAVGSRFWAWQKGVANFGQSSVAGANTTAWLHTVSVFNSTTSRIAYLAGLAGGEDTTNTGAVTATQLVIGSGVEGVNPHNGAVAEAAIWSAALTQDEVISLAKGFSPRRIRPQSLVFYAPLIRAAIDIRGGLTLTPFNSPTVTDHQRVY